MCFLNWKSIHMKIEEFTVLLIHIQFSIYDLQCTQFHS